MDAWVDRLQARASRKETTAHSNETALHEACYSGCPIEGLRKILANHPEAVAVKDSNGLTPMHWALASKMQHEKARELIDFFLPLGFVSSVHGGVYGRCGYYEDGRDDVAEEQKQEDQSNDDEVDNTDAVLTINNPDLLIEALRQTTDLGYTALHHACLSDAPSDIIKSILACHVKAASAHRNRKTPLHMLIEYVRSKESPMNTESIRLLLLAYPQAVSIMDKLGNTPLHYASYRETNLDAYILLLEASLTFDALRSRNEIGQTALHCACVADAPIEIINVLIEADPHVILTLDVNGNTPLHLACQHRASALLKSRLLVGIEGEMALGISNHRGQTPFQLCGDVGEIFEVLKLVPHFVGR